MLPTNDFDHFVVFHRKTAQSQWGQVSLLATALLLALWGASPCSAQTLDPTKDKILYMVADAHLDDQWNWTIQDTINTYIPNTLHQNFAYFANPNYSNYVFSFEEAWRYQLIKEYYPADFLTLSNYVAQGRWRIAGSAMVAGDMNAPAPESLIRHTLLANHFWKEQFGKTSVDIFLPDCFGFGWALPSVAAHCGLKGFSSQKLTWGCWTNIPFQNIGRWIGPDGASVIAVVQPTAYNSSISTNLANDSSELTRLTNNWKQTGLYLDYRYFGTGDTGGSPNDSSVSNVCLSVGTTNGAIHVLNTGSDQIFRDMTPAQVAMLPTFGNELITQTHGNGTYTSHAENKKYHRQCEFLAASAERAAVIADWLQGGGTYPKDRLNRAWTRFLWHEFHDDLTGTSIPEAYTFAWNDYLLSINELTAEQVRGLGVLAKGLNTTATGIPLVVYNPLSIAREDVVEATVVFTNGAPTAVRVFDGNGNEVPSQMGHALGNAAPVIFLANVPSLGAATYDVRASTAPCALTTGLSISSSQLENAHYRVLLNGSGDVTSIFDKLNNQQLLSGSIRWDFLYDSSPTWPSWEVMYNNVIATPTSYLGGPATFEVLESGPARVSLGVTRYNAGSAFTERIRLAAGGAGDRVEWDVSVNWNSLQTLLKVEFPLAVTNSNATFDLGLGTIQRPNETSQSYEVPAQQWADLTGSDSKYGVSIMNDCKYGWDKPSNNKLRLTILHTPAVSGSYVYEATNSIGTHRFTFGVMGHTNDWRSGQSSWVAARLNQPLQAFQTLSHSGSLGSSFSFLSLNNSNVMVKAVKRAEDGNETIVRLQELTGRAQTVQISCVSPITAARLVTGAEDPISTLTPTNGTVTVSLGGYSPMTLALTISPSSTLLATPISSPVTLPYNLDAISSDAKRTDGNFDSGITYPAELMPSSLMCDGINFQLGPTNNGAFNALSCQGQTISLPAGYNQLYMLAASATNDLSGLFTLNGRATNLMVRYFSGFIGQWEPSFVKKDEVGWLCTHRHNSGGNNDAYKFCYLFKYRLELPAGASSLVLPNVPGLRIFAMTQTINTTPETVAAGGALDQNLLPWANAGVAQTVNANPATLQAAVTLNASASADPDGKIVSYTWSTNGNSMAAGVTAVVNLPLGTNTVLLTVTDDQGAINQALTTITVLSPITLTITATPTNASSAPLTVLFTAQAGGVVISSDTTDDHLGTITARGQNSPNELATNAFDNNFASKWLDFSATSWIQYQYTNGIQRVVTNYTITSGNDAANYPGRNPASWRLLGSNDNGTNWTILDIRTNQTFTASAQTLSWNPTNTGAYNAYRLQIDSVISGTTLQLDEIQLNGPVVYSYWWSFGDGATSTAQNPSHTYTNAGDYLVILGVTSGLFNGTNTAVITIGQALTATLTATPAIGAAPSNVQFKGTAAGGNGARATYQTTVDKRGLVTAQGDNTPSELCANAFDGSTSTKWLDFANANATTRASWIQYQYANGLPYIVSQYAITTANDSPDRDPLSWHLLGSNDGASWTTLDTRTSGLPVTRYARTAFNIASPAAYNAYRLQVDSVANYNGTATVQANSVQLSEIELLGTAAYTYSWSFGDGTVSTAQNPQHTYATNGTYTVTLTVFDGAKTVVTTTTVQVLPLSLGLATAAPGNIKLTWPLWATNYTLYWTTNLTPPIVWSSSTNTPIDSGGIRSVTIPLDANSRFMQLRNP